MISDLPYISIGTQGLGFDILILEPKQRTRTLKCPCPESKKMTDPWVGHLVKNLTQMC